MDVRYTSQPHRNVRRYDDVCDRSQEASMSATESGGTIVVSGVGRVIVEPDVADLRLGVTIARDSVGEARSEAARTMAAILEALAGAGVAPRDIRTSLLSVQPRYDYRDGKPPTLVGYEMSNVVEVTVRALGTVADVVDGALRAGATSMDGLAFRVDDPTEPERAARVAAVNAARGRADILAEAAGVTIAGVSDIVEGGSAPVFARAKAERMMLAADSATPVSAGTTDIAVTVTVTYKIG
jgi:uncharacterized protein